MEGIIDYPVFIKIPKKGLRKTRAFRLHSDRISWYRIGKYNKPINSVWYNQLEDFLDKVFTHDEKKKQIRIKIIKASKERKIGDDLVLAYGKKRTRNERAGSYFPYKFKIAACSE